MSQVLVNITVHARGEMATKLLAAAEELGLPPYVVKSTSEGFRIPIEIHQHLFPSMYSDRGDPADDFADVDVDVDDGVPEDQYDTMEFPELRQAAKDRELSAGGSADEIRVRLREADAG